MDDRVAVVVARTFFRYSFPASRSRGSTASFLVKYQRLLANEGAAFADTQAIGLVLCFVIQAVLIEGLILRIGSRGP